MSEYGVDLAVWYKNRRWVALLDYIDMLPSANRLNEAILNDPESADEIAARPDPTEPWSPKVSEFDLHAVILREIVSELKVVVQTLTASGGARPKPFKPFPSPITEVDRAKKRQERKFAFDLVSEFGFGEADL